MSTALCGTFIELISQFNHALFVGLCTSILKQRT
jgi:hypothetical protein